MTMARQRRSMVVKVLLTVVLGAVAMLGAYAFLSRQSATVEIITAAKPLVPGETPNKSDLAVEAIPAKSLTPDMIPLTAAHELQNQVVAVNVPQGVPLLVNDLSPHLRAGWRVFVITPNVIPPNLVAGDTIDVFAPLQSQSATTTNKSTTYTAPVPYIPVATAVPVLDVVTSSNGNSAQLEIEVPPDEASDIAAVADLSSLVIAFAAPHSRPVPIIQLNPSVHNRTVN